MAAVASDITVEVSGPTNPTTPTTRTFKATVSYVTEAGAREVATGTRIQQNQDVPPQTLAETRSIVATTTVDTIAHGNYDGEGNSLSRERLEELGVTPGATLEFEGATFTWPDVEAGRPDAVASRGQLIALEGSGAQLAVLGSGLGRGGASGEFAINYTDGTTPAPSDSATGSPPRPRSTRKSPTPRTAATPPPGMPMPTSSTASTWPRSTLTRARPWSLYSCRSLQA